MTSKELVIRTMEFRNRTRQVPRLPSALPWANLHYPKELAEITTDYPSDITGCPAHYARPPIEAGDAYAAGDYTDAWGCRFTNLQAGVIGEVKEPLIHADDDDWDTWQQVRFPTELLSFSIDSANQYCASTDQFVVSGVTPRPFEQLQFIRGSERLYLDLASPPQNMLKFMQKLHAFYCELVEKWAKTDVDCIGFMDDWGAQNALLINPDLWRELFKPMYRDYIEIAHRHGKKAFMHSDGHILAIIPDLIELGLDAINAQLFCMGVETLAPYRGKITFWGEIDRQHLLPYGTAKEIEAAVRLVYDTLWDDGGAIAMCEFGPGAKPENVRKVYESWQMVALEPGGR